MKKLPDLKQLSDEAKDALIVELWQEIQKLRAALSTDASKTDSSPTKTSSNSSTPPSKGFKPNIKSKPSKIESVKRQKSIGRTGGGRHLHPEPDQIIIAQIKSCPQCSETITATTQKLQSVYDKIELPPIRPIVTRIERYGGRCPCCQTEYLAPVPAGMEPGSPFGREIQSSRHISALHSCDRLRTAVGNLVIRFWTQDLRRSDRQPFKYSQNQFR